MASKKQVEANRLNAQKSTGPRSAEGKARSSMNALKTGIDARTQVIRGEIWDDLQALIGEYYLRFHPTTPEQRTLVDTLIDCEWMLRRYRAVETQLWERAIDIFDESLARVFSEHAGDFARLQRRIDSTQRNFRNTLHELERLQAEQAAIESAPEPTPNPRKETPEPQNGFDPQITVGQVFSPAEAVDTGRDSKALAQANLGRPSLPSSSI